jgi:hypothetical protein
MLRRITCGDYSVLPETNNGDTLFLCLIALKSKQCALHQ